MPALTQFFYFQVKQSVRNARTHTFFYLQVKQRGRNACTHTVLLLSGTIESEKCPHSHSEMILRIMDEARRQIGVTFSEDS